MLVLLESPARAQRVIKIIRNAEAEYQWKARQAPDGLLSVGSVRLEPFGLHVKMKPVRPKVVREIADDANKDPDGYVYLAFAPDAEGEFRAWRTYELLKPLVTEEVSFYRVVLDDLTAASIIQGFAKATEYTQPTLAANRERARLAANVLAKKASEEAIHAAFGRQGSALPFACWSALDWLVSSQGLPDRQEPTFSAPPEPHIWATLLADAAEEYGWSGHQTTLTANILHNMGSVTFPYTRSPVVDSTVAADLFEEMCAIFGDRVVSELPNRTLRAGEHAAVIPASMQPVSGVIRAEHPEALNRLIWNRTALNFLGPSGQKMSKHRFGIRRKPVTRADVYAGLSNLHPPEIVPTVDRLEREGLIFFAGNKLRVTVHGELVHGALSKVFGSLVSPSAYREFERTLHTEHPVAAVIRLAVSLRRRKKPPSLPEAPECPNMHGTMNWSPRALGWVCREPRCKASVRAGWYAGVSQAPEVGIPISGKCKKCGDDKSLVVKVTGTSGLRYLICSACNEVQG